jgi:rod shape-determining protein MreD
MTRQAARHPQIAVYLSLFVALTLQVMPLADSMQAFRPAWVILALLHWGIYLPERIGIWSAFVTGLLLDLLLRNPLGQTSIELVAIIFITLRLHRQLRLFPLLQQTLSLLPLIVLALLIRIWVIRATGQAMPDLGYWLVVPGSALCWPLLWKFLQLVQDHYKLR